MTTTKVGYDALLKQVRIPEFTKRSDIMITSTLSMSIFPKDKRMIQNVHLANMNEDELIEYIDQKNAFKALNKELEYQIGTIKEKDEEFKENYMKSFIHRSNFVSETLSAFKGRVEKLNSNKKQIRPKSKEQLNTEKLKHEQNKRASEKRGLPRFDMEMARKLLDGKFHEADDIFDDDENALMAGGKAANLNKAFTAKTADDLEKQNKFDEFESALH
jgi:hypothetical protein